VRRGIPPVVSYNKPFEKQARAHPDQITILRTAVARYAEGLGADSEACGAVRLAVSEALTNVVKHAYLGNDPGYMTVRAWRDEDGTLVVSVLDDGQGLAARVDRRGLGLGLGLMAQMADDFRIATRDGASGTAVTLRFALARSRSPSGGSAGGAANRISRFVSAWSPA
jgi:serine/threonine-protein kinase RsbW